jgi:hypothetical protein
VRVGNRTDPHDVPIQVGLPNRHFPAIERLNAVSADSATDVWAVGTVQRGERQSTLIEHWDGTRWTKQETGGLDQER